MKRSRIKLTYANVMATVAVFIALGGASYAAVKLPKNSVGAKQIKNNAITGAKIKNGAVTGAKIAPGTITGSNVNAATLGTVPAATHSNSADNAANATHSTTSDSAGNTASLGGKPASAYATAELEPEHIIGAPGEPAFEHGCVDVGAGTNPAGFYKDAFGVVHLRGFISGCTNEQSAFTLPPGFRPTGTEVGGTGTGNATSGLIRVDPSGTVTVFGSGTQVFMDVAFRTT
jgi:hypothetical protein